MSRVFLAVIDTKAGELRRYFRYDDGRVVCDSNVQIQEWDKILTGEFVLDPEKIEAYRTDPAKFDPGYVGPPWDHPTPPKAA